MMTLNRKLCMGFAVILASAAFAADQPAGAKDHPLISRFAGSTVAEYSVTDFDQYPLVTGPYREAGFKFENLEGKVTHFRYSNPPGHTSFEIIRSYQNALRQGGFQIIFTCGEDCGNGRITVPTFGKWIGSWCLNDNVYCGDQLSRYVAAKLSRPTGTVYIAVRVALGGHSNRLRQDYRRLIAGLPLWVVSGLRVAKLNLPVERGHVDALQQTHSPPGYLITTRNG